MKEINNSRCWVWSTWELFLLPLQLFYKSKTIIKQKVYLKTTTLRYYFMPTRLSIPSNTPKYMDTKLFTVALFLVTKYWEQPEPSTRTGLVNQ